MRTQTLHGTAVGRRHRSGGRVDFGDRANRRGSTIIVVLALLGALMLLGFLVYTLAAQNQVSATYFANSDTAKVPKAKVDPDVLFNNVLRQIIVGPDVTEYNSALWGGDKSLMATLFGRDLQPYTGRGIHLAWDSGTNQPFVDQDYNNAADMNQRLLEINKSPAAQGTVLDLVNRPDPDVDYSAPDINSPFLSYNALLPNGTRVVIPSFHRPQILRNVTPSGPGDWYTNSATARRVLRPHVEHRAIAADGTVTATRRFVSAAFPDPAAPPLKLNPYPFPTAVKEGVWTGTAPGPTAYDGYNVDLDGDGIKEAVYLDYGFPLLTSPDGLTQFVPMAAVTIKCADSRFNLNTHGNAYGDVRQRNVRFGGQDASGQTQLISKSDTGYGYWEVNPQYGLRAIPNLADFSGNNQAELNAVLEPHRFAFRTTPNLPTPTANNPTDAKELSNMEWWFLLTGRADFSSGGSGISVLHAGRWGETDRLRNGIDGTPPLARDFPAPGISNVDDNNNQLESGPFPPGLPLYPPFVMFQRFRHPIDLFGSGRRTKPSTFGRQVDLFQLGRMSYARYRNYVVNPNLGYVADNSLLGNNLLIMGNNVPVQSADRTVVSQFEVDEPGETIVEPRAAQTQTADDIFGPDENAALELPTPDLTQLGIQGRAISLAPYNFWASSQSQEIRRLFATTGWDLKSRGQTFYDPLTGTSPRFRPWEWTNRIDGDGNLKRLPWFPNASLASQPFRPVLRDLLTINVRNQAGIPLKAPQRKFSINGVLDRSPNGRLFFRPLTPHPTGLDRDPIVTRLSVNPVTRPNQIQNIYDQEFLARRDRQLMCRDIYVMLYTFCGVTQNSGGTFLNYTTDPTVTGTLLYTDAQLKEMAQFAVNLVDALDPDDHITLFEYDKNLGNGWNLDDNPYTNGDTSNGELPEPFAPAAADERGVVAGVEAQTLCFNEALATFAKKVLQAGVGFNHPATEYDDRDNRDFLHIELQNVSSRTVTFANNAWQIVVRPVNEPGSTNAIAGMEERRLTLTSNAPNVGTGAAPGSLYTIGTAGDNLNVDGSGNIRPSFIKVNVWYQHPTNDMGVLSRIVPRGALTLDLMVDPVNTYDVVRRQPSGNFGDGPHFSSTPASPSGANLLELGPNKNAIDGSSFINVELELRRRVDLHRAPPIFYDTVPADHVAQSKDNPWTVVDRLTVPLRVMALQNTDKWAELQGTNGVQTLTSQERLRALFGFDNTPRTGLINGLNNGLLNAAFQKNSLGQVNDSGGSPIPASQAPLWQPHFDRDFTSVAELFDVPLYGPHQLTEKMAAITGSGSARRIFLRGDDTAGVKFLQPRGGAVGNIGDPQGVTPSLWYRLLGLVGVPDRAHRQFENPTYTIDAGRIGGANPLGVFRVPGRIQLNTLAHPEILMGLLDDRDVVDMTLPANGPPTGLTDKSNEPGGRDWWRQFLEARDGRDPISGQFLPGVPGISRPFHGLSFAARELNSIQDTILRALPKDGAPGGAVDNARELFEIGTLNDHRPGGPIDPQTNTPVVDYSNRHRLLGKVLDNSTTRSNVFLVYIQIDYFSAREVTDGGTGKKVVRIGAKLANSPGYRSFYVIDRSKAADSIQPQDLPNASTGRFLYTFQPTFDYRSLILHQQRIQ